MKTLFKTLVATVISLSFICTGFAGQDMKDCVHMKDGKMMMMKDGKEMTLKDGDMVAMDGTMTKGGMKKDKEDKEGEKK